MPKITHKHDLGPGEALVVFRDYHGYEEISFRLGAIEFQMQQDVEHMQHTSGFGGDVKLVPTDVTITLNLVGRPLEMKGKAFTRGGDTQLYDIDPTKPPGQGLSLLERFGAQSRIRRLKFGETQERPGETDDGGPEGTGNPCGES